MSDEAALLAAILAHPDEDTPRLMYADWLAENGQPDRAEFIRIQCAPGADESRWQRARELEESNCEKWLAGFPQFPAWQWEVGRRTWVFRRGFPEHLAAPIDDFLDRYTDSASVPWLCSLSLSYVDAESLQDFANRSWNSRWVELAIEGPWSIRGIPPDYTSWVRVLAGCPQASQLRLLWFSGLFDLTPEGSDLLVTSPYLENLRQLHLCGDDADPQFDPLRARFGDRLIVDWDHPARPRM